MGGDTRGDKIMHTPGRVHKPCTPVQSIVFNIHPPIPFVILALLLPSLLVVTQIRGHIGGPPPPSPLRYNNAFTFIARRIQHFLPSSTRVDLYLPTLLGALSSLSFCCIFVNKVKISPRWESNSRTNATNIRGQPLDHRGGRCL